MVHHEVYDVFVADGADERVRVAGYQLGQRFKILKSNLIIELVLLRGQFYHLFNETLYLVKLL